MTSERKVGTHDNERISRIHIRKHPICSCFIELPSRGDSGHGGITTLELVDEAATAWEVSISGRVVDSPDSIKLTLFGDTEADTFAAALEFAASRLRAQIGNRFVEPD